MLSGWFSAVLGEPTWLLAAPALLPAALGAFNLAAWPRGRPDGRFDGRVSALVPARNEEQGIEACVRALLDAEPRLDEVIVYDDGSTDETPAILARLAAGDDRLRVLRGAGLPAGWVGKPHACHQLAQEATGDVLLFIDADTTLLPGGGARIADLMRRLEADAVSAMPRQEVGGFFERLMLPLLHITYISWLPLPLIWRSSDPRFLAANGQVFAIRRPAYDATGGHQAVREEVVEDMALSRLVKTSGGRLVFADGHHIARCRMYRSARGVWEGFSKNLYEGLGEQPLLLVAVLALYFAAFVAPYLALAASPWALALLPPALVGVAANLGLRLACAARYDQPVGSALLHPIGVLALLVLAVNSARWVRSGQIRWAGRTYAARAARGEP